MCKDPSGVDVFWIVTKREKNHCSLLFCVVFIRPMEGLKAPFITHYSTFFSLTAGLIRRTVRVYCLI